MKSTLALVATGCLLATASAVPVDTFKACNGYVGSIELSTMESAGVWPPVPGYDLDTITAMKLTKGITGGTVTMATTWNGFKVDTKTVPIGEYGNFPANGETGLFQVRNTGLFPADAPAGDYSVLTRADDQNGQKAFCYTIAFKV